MGTGAEGLLSARRRVRSILRSADEKLASREGASAGRSAFDPAVSSSVLDELNRATEALRRFISRRNAAAPAREVPALFRGPLPTTPEGARAWLEEVLRRRRKKRFDRDEIYTIPLDQLQFKGTLGAIGPSLVEGDYFVKFDYYERVPGKPDKVPIFSEKGSKAGKDMQLVSGELFKRIHHCLRLLPGYTETCVETGTTITQPLQAISIKLLRGEITTIDQIYFRNRSPKGNTLLQREEARKSVPPSRRKHPTSLSQEAEVLLKDGNTFASAAKTLKDLFPKATRKTIEKALREAQARHQSQ